MLDDFCHLGLLQYGIAFFKAKISVMEPVELNDREKNAETSLSYRLYGEKKIGMKDMSLTQ